MHLTETENLRRIIVACLLRGLDLTYADLRSLDLSAADLKGTDLRSAILTNVDLRGADFRGLPRCLCALPGTARLRTSRALRGRAA